MALNACGAPEQASDVHTNTSRIRSGAALVGKGAWTCNGTAGVRPLQCNLKRSGVSGCSYVHLMHGTCKTCDLAAPQNSHFVASVRASRRMLGHSHGSPPALQPCKSASATCTTSPGSPMYSSADMQGPGSPELQISGYRSTAGDETAL